METCANYTDEDMYFSSDEKKHIRKILQLKDSHPDDVKIIKMPEDNQGCIYAVIPAKWFKISPPRKLDLSDEQRAALAQRVKNFRVSSNSD